MIACFRKYSFQRAASMDSIANESDVAAPAVEAADAGSTHDTLKYHLLGPSLTKAGQDTVDQRKVSGCCFAQ
jgi:hypothetical protein